jgi:hypothetical protein
MTKQDLINKGRLNNNIMSNTTKKTTNKKNIKPEEMINLPAEKNFKEKLLLIQSELKAPKNQVNDWGKSKFKYRSCEDILEALKPILLKYRVVLSISDEVVLTGERYYLKASACLEDVESEDKKVINAFARESESKAGMDLSQITGSASSYARKYALNGLFCIDDTKDPDSQNNRKEGELEEKVNNAKTREELTKIYKSNKGKGKEFDKLVAKKAEELKKGIEIPSNEIPDDPVVIELKQTQKV